MQYEYFWILATITLTTGLVGCFVLSFDRGYQKSLNRSFFYFCLAIVGWSGNGCLLLLSSDENNATFITRLMIGFSTLIPLLYAHFVYRLTNKKKDSVMWATEGFALLLIYSTFFGKILLPAKAKYEFTYMMEAGPAYFLYVIYFVMLVSWTIFTLVVHYQKATGLYKKQIFYVLIGTGLGFFGGTTNLWVPFNLWAYPINPYASLTCLVFIFSIIYAMVQYRLMDIKIFFRKVSLLVAIYVSILALTVPFVFMLHNKVVGDASISKGYFGFEIIVIGLLFSAGPALYAWLVQKNSYFKEETMSGLTHELKSPLAIIESALEALQSNSQIKPAVGAQKDYMEMMERNLVRVQASVNNLLFVFGNKKQNMQLDLNDANLRTIADDAILIHTDAAHHKSIDLTNQIPQDLNIACDSNRLGQIFSNLISNALKFTPKGSITISATRIPNFIQVSVRDTGIGLDPKDLTLIFDRFYQAPHKKSVAGTGIGLTIAKIWVEAHGGQIWAESEGEGKGTTISFTLPQ